MLTKENVNFLDYFSSLEDQRIERRKLHPMKDILLLTLCWVICGCEGWEDLKEFGKQRLDFLRRYCKWLPKPTVKWRSLLIKQRFCWRDSV